MSSDKKFPNPLSLPNNADFGPFFDELNHENDRSVAIVGASYMEWQVVQALRQHMTSWKNEAVEYLLGTGSSWGLLRYNNKCQLALKLGLVGKLGFADLERIGNIRNRFAHQLDIRSFSDPRVNDLCLSLDSVKQSPFTARISDKSEFAQPRSRFIMTLFQLEGVLHSSACKLAHGEKEGHLHTFW